MNTPVKALLATCGSWHLRQTAKAFEKRAALASLWTSDKNVVAISTSKYRRCWPFHIAMKPFYHLPSQILREKMFYVFLPLWRVWVKSQPLSSCNVVQAIMGY